jgi:glutamyl/glutaminyl-tRNA synthetase
MSYLSQLKKHQITAKEFLGKSVNYLAAKLGVTVTVFREPAGKAEGNPWEVLTDEARALLGQIVAQLEASPAWAAEPLEAAIKALAETLGLGLGKLAQPLRAALTGTTISPGIYDVLVLLGRDEALGRLRDQLAVASTV